MRNPLLQFIPPSFDLLMLKYAHGEQVRSAACIWLVSLVSFNSSSQALRRRLKDIQEAFGNLLGDADELIQEMASRGISAVYRLGSDADRKQLLGGLMSTLQGVIILFLCPLAICDDN